jgi:hypothetical protein
MTIMTQPVPIKTPAPIPGPAPGPFMLIAKLPLAPPLFLGKIQIVGSLVPPSPDTGTVSPGSAAHPGSAQIYMNTDAYRDFRTFLMTNPSPMAVDITYNDQNHVVSGFEGYRTGVPLAAELEHISNQLDEGVEQLRTLNSGVQEVLQLIRHRVERLPGDGRERLDSDVAPKQTG